MSTEANRPIKHTVGRTMSNRDWWPNQLNLKVPHQNSPLSDPMGQGFNYARPFKSLHLAVILGALLFALNAAPARAGSFTFDSFTTTYTYTGDFFNFCGFGCPDNAPADPRGADRIIATLTYGAILDPNLTDAMPAPISWTMNDLFGALNLGGAGLPPDFPGDIEEPPLPGLVLSTDATGNIIRWFMSAFSGGLNGEGRFEGTGAFVANPPIFCGEECNNMGITDILAVNQLSDTEWDALVLVPAQAPEPATLTLVAGGLLIVARRRRLARPC